jgi:prepilin peptidase CpaA
VAAPKQLSPGWMSMVFDVVRMALFPALMAFAASSDLLTMTISNRLCLLLLAGFVVLCLLAGLSASDILLHLAAGALVLIVTFGFFTRGWIGGGDAKLAAATAVWLGFDHLLAYFIYASLFGGALTVLIIQFRMIPLPAALARQEWVERLHRKEGGVPYGIALALAALVVYPDTAWMNSIAL